MGSIKDGAPITLIASLGGPSSCFGVSIGSPSSTTTVLDVGNVGALTATHAALYIAPTGCTVGQFTIAPGVALAFDGRILGVGVKANINLTPAPFRLEADVTIGAVSTNGFALDGATAHVVVSGTAQTISFAASGSLFGVRAAVSGAFTRSASGVILDFSGTFSSPNLGGFQLGNLTTTFHYTSGSSGTTLAATAQGAASLLGANVNVSLALTFVNGVVTEMSGTAALDIPISTARLTGTGAFHFVAGQFPDVTVAGSLTVSGMTVSTVQATLTRGGLTFAGDLTVAPVIDANITGAIAFKNDGTTTIQVRKRDGTLVTANPGDFRFDVVSLTVGVAGFDLTGSASVGNVAGVQWADLAVSRTLGIDTTNANVNFRGGFTSAGDFDLAGNASVSIGGMPAVNMAFTASRHGTAVALTGQATLTFPQAATVSFSGSFSRTTAGTSYSLTGRAALSPGGFNLGTADFTAFRELQNTAYGRLWATGVTASLTLSVPRLAAANVSGSIGGDGSFWFTATTSATGVLANVLGNPQVSVFFLRGKFCLFTCPATTPITTTFSFGASVGGVFGLPGSATVQGLFQSDGSFNLSAAVTAGPWRVSKSAGLCRAYARASGTLNVTIAGTSSTLTVSGSFSLHASAGCGVASLSISVSGSFVYRAPDDIVITVKADLSGWHPTLFSITV